MTCVQIEEITLPSSLTFFPKSNFLSISADIINGLSLEELGSAALVAGQEVGRGVEPGRGRVDVLDCLLPPGGWEKQIWELIKV